MLWGIVLKSSIEAVLEYLVVKALVGRTDVLNALQEYFIMNRSPSVIATRYGLSKHQVRGYVQRVVEKAGSIVKARVIVRKSTPYISRIRPIVRHTSYGMVRCLVCGDEMPAIVSEDHVRKHHQGLVEEYVATVIQLLKREVLKSRAKGGIDA